MAATNGLETLNLRKGILNTGLVFAGIVIIYFINLGYLEVIKSTDLIKLSFLGDQNLMQTNSLTMKAKSLFYFSSTTEWIQSLSQIIISKFSFSMPIIFAVVLIYAYLLLTYDDLKTSKNRRFELFLILFILSGIFTMSFFDYRPNRYRMPMIPGFCLLGAIALIRLSDNVNKKIKIEANKRSVAILCTFVFIIFFRLFRVIFVYYGFKEPNITVFVLSFIAVIASIFLFRRIAQLRFRLHERTISPLVIAIIAVCLSWQIFQYLQWALNPRYDIRDGNAQIRSLIKDGIIAGQYAPILCLESNNIAFPLMYGNITYFKKLKITHYLDAVGHYPNGDFTILENRYHGFLSQYEKMIEIPIGFTTATLFKYKGKIK